MSFAADYPFLDILWSMLIFFCFVVWIWMMIAIFSDIFRRRDIGGWAKAAWCFFLIVLPFLGAFVYLIAQHDGMAERNLKGAQAMQAELDQHIRSVAQSSGPAAEIDKAKQLRDSGAITEAEFEAIKAKALA
jgi:putative oligomerization/nucleic acid binding protein/phospholipase D-like protein